MTLWTALGVAILTVVIAYYLANRVSRPRNADVRPGIGDDTIRYDTVDDRDEEFATDFDYAEQVELEMPLPNNVMDFSEYQEKRNAFEDGDVKLSPPKPAVGRELTVRYRGMLADEKMVSMRYGYGYSSWENINEVPMFKEDGIWKAELKVSGIGRLNICFHDQDDKWDNNDGKDWSWDITL